MNRNPFTQAMFFGACMLLMLSACQKETNRITGDSTENETELEFEKSTPILNKYIVTLDEQALRSAKRSPLSLKDLVRDAANDLFAKYPDPTVPNSIDYVYAYSIVGFAGSMSATTAQQLLLDPRVKAVEQDMVIGLGKGNKPGSGTGTPPAQSTPPGITRVNGTDYTGSNVAWIIDSGIDTDHPDLNVDASRGFSAFTSGKDAGTDDGHGHGTHVSGTVAAINNDIGVVGVAAGATVIPVKVLNSRGSGSNSGVIAGVDWVGQNGISGDVANMSLGGGTSSALDNAVIGASNQQGVVFCIAAGNSSANANTSSPARANGNYIYTISAVDKDDVFASFSNYGNPPIDYAAPGVNIYSTHKGGSYNTMSGTSMAAPHASGVVLLGTPQNGGTAINDRDNTPDVIIVH
jgi:subtilisin family serine protease